MGILVRLALEPDPDPDPWDDPLWDEPGVFIIPFKGRMSGRADTWETIKFLLLPVQHKTKQL